MTSPMCNPLPIHVLFQGALLCNIRKDLIDEHHSVAIHFKYKCCGKRSVYLQLGKAFDTHNLRCSSTVLAVHYTLLSFAQLLGFYFIRTIATIFTQLMRTVSLQTFSPRWSRFSSQVDLRESYESMKR
jgi:hypothetical protein